MQSILAVGYTHRVDILCQQRMTYFAEDPGWGLCRTIDVSRYVIHNTSKQFIPLTWPEISYTPYPISDSIWLAHCSFLVASGQQMYLFSEPPTKIASTAKERSTETLVEYVARQNGPLDEYHPQMLLQCLIWGELY